MIVLAVSIKIKPERIGEFVDATRRNHEGSVAEPGCLRFDVVQDTEDPGHFMLYEVYEDQTAVDAHRGTEHYARWRDAVEDLLTEPRTRVLYRSVFPDPWR